jgi:hypothetical protein
MKNFISRYRDDLASLFGTIVGISSVCVANDVFDSQIVGTIGGVAAVLLGAVTNYGVNSIK